jgi:Bacterial TSP3 repeat
LPFRVIIGTQGSGADSTHSHHRHNACVALIIAKTRLDAFYITPIRDSRQGDKMKKTALHLILFFVSIGILACGGGGGGGEKTLPRISTSAISGSAIKGPVDGGAIQLFYFDDTGSPIEIIAVNAPVITDTTGAFNFSVNGPDLIGISSPLVVRSSGGNMYGGPAPTLEAIIEDPLPLTFSEVNITCNLSAASSVAAGLLRKQAQSTGFAPSYEDARQVLALVEEQLHVDISSNPANSSTSLAMLNDCIDQNLDLINTPGNSPAVDEFIAYLVANLGSSSGSLDLFMDDPSNPGSDISAGFTPFGAGALANLFPAGPEDLILMTLSSDRQFVEDDNREIAIVSAKLYNAQGEPSIYVNQVQLAMWTGPGNLYLNDIDYGSGKMQANLTSLQSGDNVIRAEFTLSNGNTITQQITVTAVNLFIDTDGDGYSDGAETIGWEITIDALGYGSDGEGRFMEKRTVTSDPDLADTDGDGLDDYTEYLIRTDPRISDTDGDGLTDAEEWNRWVSSPTSVDTDGDARGPDRNLPPKPDLFDGNELLFLNTSPTLVDTDGDGWTDYEEFDHPSRSPKIADLPRLALFVEDNIDVRLDVSYAEEAGETTQYGTVLTKSNTVTASRYNSRTIGHSLMVGGGFSFGLFGGASVNTEYTFSQDETVAFTSESSRTAQSAFSRYNTESRTRTESAATGSMTMGIRLINTGNITYTITQLGITARQWLAGETDPEDPAAPGAFSTIATLVPALDDGITLAPGSTSPVLQLQVENINVDRIKGLLARPDSLRLEPAYYELENAEGLNFAYLEEITGPRTALLALDFGDGRVEEYRVAALVDRNSDSTFAGVTLGEVMNQILSIPYETRPRRVIDPGASTNENVLYSVKGLATVEDNLEAGFWTVILTGGSATQSGSDFEDITIHGGEQAILTFISDTDGDGLYAPEEQHYRTDLSSDDTDGDGLTDTEEARGGWTVTLPTASWFITSDPTEADQDEDGLNDLMEKTAGTDPTLPDTDRDGLGDSYDPHPLHPARVLHVKEGGSAISDGLSWATALGSLTEALVEAQTGNATPEPEDDVAEIWVAQGRYVPSTTGDRNVSFDLSPGISVFGGFTGVETKFAQRNNAPLSFPTFLSGDLSNNDAESYVADPTSFADNSVHVLRAAETVDQNTLLDGFYVVGGNADDPSDPAYGDGGGMLSYGNPTLRNLFFRTNRANNGAGLSVRLAVSQDRGMSINDCIFNRNLAFYDTNAGNAGGGGLGGGMFYSGTDSFLTMERVEFRENESWGGAGLFMGGTLSADISQGIFDKNNARNFLIAYNQGSGGGANISADSTVRFDRCRFTSNEGTYGGGISCGDNARVQLNQAVFWGNRAWLIDPQNYGGGGAIYARPDASIWIINTTIAGNSAYDELDNITPEYQGQYGKPGGILAAGTTFFHIENSVIYYNYYYSTDSGTYPNTGLQQIMGGTLTVSTSDIQGLSLLSLGGNGNIDGEPAFVDSDFGNLKLAPESPCIDAGSNYVDYDPISPGFQFLPQTDAAGNVRIVDGNGSGEAIVDMGSFEYQEE